MEATVRAVHGVVGRGGTVFAFVTRRGDAAAFRCVACGELRRCPDCGAAATRGDVCARCGRVHGACAACGGARFQALGAAVGRLVHDLRRSLGDVVTPVGEGGTVQVGTERDLPGVAPVDLAVVVDPDSLILAPHYRAEEDALRTLARVALTVAPRRGRRCLIQTTQPGHRVLEAMRHGRPRPLLDVLLAEREAAGFPPAGELMAIEIAGATGAVDEELRTVAQGAQVTGPAAGEDRQRWLVAAGDLRPLKLRLRGEVQRWRDAGYRVRIDADPVRL
jgi:primosomal protein N' (replication factor Y)